MDPLGNDALRLPPRGGAGNADGVYPPPPLQSVALRRGEVAVFAGAALEARFTAVGNLGATLRAAEHEVSVAAGNGPRLSLAFKVTDW